ncbi:unnamed protein product [Acanthoscelides obtectus]|uniref:Uncharacterized protein n=1 Tax=Acanthoscelides obtectus TaxID=200917 RepID=A0A9P0PP91_ACAOB|nr:unnamed protein product [Acanthoscelides obtectus]CAK1652402.1 hypothetical protein AOBTE_LOCUS17816 [Acanthoscelides obtectus]
MAKIAEKAGNDLRQDGYSNKAGPSGIRREGGHTSQRQHGTSKTAYNARTPYKATSYRPSLNRQRPPRQSGRDSGPRKGQTSKQIQPTLWPTD